MVREREREGGKERRGEKEREGGREREGEREREREERELMKECPIAVLSMNGYSLLLSNHTCSQAEENVCMKQWDLPIILL